MVRINNLFIRRSNIYVFGLSSTIFKYQKIITPSIKGLTLIWPTDFTHTHKGQITDKEKIITGKFNDYDTPVEIISITNAT